MTTFITFNNLNPPIATASQLDANLQLMNVQTNITCVASHSTATINSALSDVYTLSVIGTITPPPAYQTGMTLCAVIPANNTTTGGTYVNFNGLGNIQVRKDTPSTPQPLNSGDLVAGNFATFVYDSTLAGGGFHLDNPTPSTIETTSVIATSVYAGGYVQVGDSPASPNTMTLTAVAVAPYATTTSGGHGVTLATTYTSLVVGPTNPTTLAGFVPAVITIGTVNTTIYHPYYV